MLYLNNLGKRLNDPVTTPKNYWKIIHRVMNKSRAPKIPPLIHMGNFVLKCTEKAKLFNDHFAKQCTLLINDCFLPEFTYLTDKRIETVTLNNANILSLVRNLNPNKAAGPDGISGQMLLLCDETVVLPLRIIFTNITNLCPGITQTLFTFRDKTSLQMTQPSWSHALCRHLIQFFLK